VSSTSHFKDRICESPNSNICLPTGPPVRTNGALQGSQSLNHYLQLLVSKLCIKHVKLKTMLSHVQKCGHKTMVPHEDQNFSIPLSSFEGNKKESFEVWNLPHICHRSMLTNGQLKPSFVGKIKPCPPAQKASVILCTSDNF
jgi:hypothetical protein